MDLQERNINQDVQLGFSNIDLRNNFGIPEDNVSYFPERLLLNKGIIDLFYREIFK